jgi:hypothetical protein
MNWFNVLATLASLVVFATLVYAAAAIDALVIALAVALVVYALYRVSKHFSHR